MFVWQHAAAVSVCIHMVRNPCIFAVKLVVCSLTLPYLGSRLWSGGYRLFPLPDFEPFAQVTLQSNLSNIEWHVACISSKIVYV